MQIFLRNKKNLKTIIHILISVESGGSELESLAIVANALSPFRPVTCLQPIGDPRHIYRKGRNETGRHLV